MAKQNLFTKYAYTPAICWGILIVYFSLMPGNEVPSLLKNMQDAGLHFAIYAIFGLLLYLAATAFQLQPISNSLALIIFAFGSLLGFIIEILQEQMIDGRTFEWGDVVANMAGCSVVFLMNVFARKKSTKTTDSKFVA